MQKVKARVVAGGYIQRPSIDFSHFHALFVDLSVVLLVLNMTPQRDWHALHVDLKVAFLNRYIDPETFVSRPKNLPSDVKSM